MPKFNVILFDLDDTLIHFEDYWKDSAKAEEVLFIGDSWKNDVEGPMQAGIQSIWYNKKNEAVPEGVTPYGVINSIFELKNYL